LKINRLNSWDLTPKEAIALQKELQHLVIVQNGFKKIETIAGADMAIDDKKGVGFAGVVVYSFPDLKEIERAHSVQPIKFPYVPGLLSFREAPILCSAFEELKTAPDMVMIDGQGIAHPRSMGIACHMGLCLGIPTIGCAKSRLVGEHDEPGRNVGDFRPLIFEGKVVGAVLRTRKDVKPLYISPGHMIDLETAVKITLACLDGTRIPKPTREADRFVAALKRRGV
jgi:deoxyribonuclease V